MRHLRTCLMFALVFNLSLARAQEADAPVKPVIDPTLPKVSEGNVLIEGVTTGRFVLKPEPPFQDPSIPVERRKRPNPKEAPVSNTDPDADILTIGALVRIELETALTEGTRVFFNGVEAERASDQTRIFFAPVDIQGVRTRLDIQLKPDPKARVAPPEAVVAEEGKPAEKPKPIVPALKGPEKYTFEMIYPEWQKDLESHLESHSAPKWGTLTPGLGFAIANFKQTNTPPLSQFGLWASVDYVKQSLWKRWTVLKAQISALGLPFGGTDVVLQDDVTIQTVDVSLLAGYSFFAPGDFKSLSILGGIFWGSSKVTATISGYQALLWPEIQIDGGIYLTPKTRIGAEVSFSPAITDGQGLDFGHSRFVVDATYLYRWKPKWNIYAKAGLRTLSAETFLGEFTGSTIAASGGFRFKF